MLNLIIVSSLAVLSVADQYGDYDEYGYDEECNCDEICGDDHCEDWEYSYDEIPPCVIEHCGSELDKCASDDSCVIGIEGVVNVCYANNEDPMQCMDDLVQDTETNQFTQYCGGNNVNNEECGIDLQSLGECVISSANYGLCPEEVYKKLQLKSLAKTIKIRSRKLKRKSAALKSKSKRSRRNRRNKRSRTKKVRGRRQSKLRSRKMSRRKLQSDYGSDYENPEYDYGCYCDCGEEDDELPSCIINNCGQEINSCMSLSDCIDGIEGVENICNDNYDSPQECVEELIQDSNGQQAIELCNNNEIAAGHLQALGQCALTTFNSGDCDNDQYKKLKIKALVKSTKRVRARKIASKQKRSRSMRRHRSARAQRLRKLKQRQRRSSRRKLQSFTDGSCCDCTESKYSPNCNQECDNTICPYDPYCCNNSWDWICANSAVQECDGSENENDFYPPPSKGSGECCKCTESSNSPNCNDECDENICSYDPYCCNNKWDWICADAAKDECAAAGNTDETDVYEGEETNPTEGSDEACCDCTESESGTGCSANPSCDAIVCPLDSYCCNYSWDGICANGAQNICDAVDYWSWPTNDYNDYDYYGDWDSFNYYDEPDYYSDEYSYYEPNYDYGYYSYSYYSPSGDFTYSDEPYYNSDQYSYYDDDLYNYEYEPNYDYGGSDSYYYYEEEEMEEDIPECFMNACYEQIYSCISSEDCFDGVEGIESICDDNYDTPEQCVEEVIEDSNGEQVIELCNGNEDAAGDLQELGECFLNTVYSGECDEEYKKLKVKSLVKATKKVKARKVRASRQRKARSSKRARSARVQKQKQRRQRSRKVRPRTRRSLSQRQRRARSSRRARQAQRQRSRKVRARSRRASAQRQRQRQRRSQRARRQKKRLRRY